MAKFCWLFSVPSLVLLFLLSYRKRKIMAVPVYYESLEVTAEK